MDINKKIIKFLEEFIRQDLNETVKLTQDSKLFGGGGPLDSLALVSLVVELEEFIEDEFGIEVTLADEKAMSRRTSPFSRVSYLIDHIMKKINNA